MVTLDKLLNLYNPQFFGRVGHATWFVRSCCCSVAKSCLTPCDSVDFSTSGFPVLHYLPGFEQTHVQWIDNVILSSHPLLPPPPPPSIFPSIRVSSNELVLMRLVAKILELQLQHQSVQSLSCVWLFATLWTAAHQASLSIINSLTLVKLMSIESVMPSNHLILCHLLLLPPSIFPSIKVFSKESVLRFRWPKYWSFSFSISPPNEYSGLISFKMDWLDLLAVQGTLKSLLQHHSSKASILQ